MVQDFDTSRYFDHIASAAHHFQKAKEYQRALKLLFKCWQTKGTVFTMGCGGSASTATHFAADLAKTTIVKDKPRFKTMALVDNIPLVSAWTNDYGWGSVFAEQLEPWLTEKDVLVGFSVHGGSGKLEADPWSQNLVQAMKMAKARGVKIIGFTGFDGGVMKKMADVCVIVPTNSDVYGTPVVEGMHIVLHHGIIFMLREMMKNA